MVESSSHGITPKEEPITLDRPKSPNPFLPIIQANPKESHLIAVKRIFRYLKGTPSLGLWNLKCLGFDLKGYSDSDYAGCNMGRKSTLGDIELHFIPTQYQHADIYTKTLDEPTFKRLIVEL
nr:uncharacterized mitochondrial protein AtMg00810-like [Tanacetum cinerariifolium]